MISTDGLQDIVDALAERLQRSVAVDDPAIRLIVASRHFGDEDPVRVQSVLGREVDREITQRVYSFGVERFPGPGRIPAMPEVGAKPRVCAPVRCSGLLLGYLWLIDDDRLTDEAIADAGRAAEACGLILFRQEIAFERRQSHVDALLRDLTSSDEFARARAADELDGDRIVSDSNRTTAVVIGLTRDAAEPDESSRDLTGESGFGKRSRLAVRAYPDGSLICLVRRSRAVFLVTGHVHPPQQVANDLTEQFARDLGLDGRRVVAGIGSTVEGLREAHHSYQQAVVATRAAEFLPGLGAVVAWDSLGVYALLAKLDPQDLRLTGYPAPLLRLADHRNADTLIHTAEVYLDSAGDAQRTAESLFIHRTTLYQRLARIEQLSGLRFKNGTDRLTLHLSIKLARLSGDFETQLGPRHP